MLAPVSDPEWRECVAQHRLRYGLTKLQLAERCGISRTTVYRIETGKCEASEAHVSAIEQVLGEARTEYERQRKRQLLTVGA